MNPGFCPRGAHQVTAQPSLGYEATYCVETETPHRKHGPEILVDPDGTLVHRGTYSRGVRSGHWQYFGPKSAIVAEGTIDNELRTGMWRFFNASEEEIAALWYAKGIVVKCSLAARGIGGTTVWRELDLADCAELEATFRRIVLR